MKALVKNKEFLRVVDMPIPLLRRSTDVTIRVAAAAVCRTDLYAAEGKIKTANPVILGHEFSGEIATSGARAERFKPGDRVAVNPFLPCMVCPVCVAGRPFSCGWAEFLGVHRNGAFAEFVTVPSRAVIRLPDSVSFIAGAFLEPVAASLAVFNAGIQSYQTGLVFGEDRIAKLTQKILAARGFPDVKMRGLSPSNPSDANAFDFIVDTLGTSEALGEIVRLVRPGGTIVLKSRPIEPATLNLNELLRKEIRLHAVNYGSFDDAVALLAEKVLDIESLVGKTARLEEFKTIFAAAHEDELLKPFFVMK